MTDFSWLAVLIGAVAFFALGAVWYSLLFRNPWAKDMGYLDDMPEAPQAPPIGTMLGSVAVAAVVAAVIEYFTRDTNIETGLKVGLGVGLAVVAVMGQNALYDNRTSRLYLINAGYPLVGCLILGVISGAV